MIIDPLWIQSANAYSLSRVPRPPVPVAPTPNRPTDDEPEIVRDETGMSAGRENDG